jgi:TonB family protein
MRCWLLALAFLFVTAIPAQADEKAREDAILMLRKASDLETFKPGEAPKFSLEVHFKLVRGGKEAVTGIFTREDNSAALWHEELALGPFHFRRVRIKRQIWTRQNSDFIPLPVEGLWGALYWSNFGLADTDIAKRVKEKKIDDVPARCIEIESVRGDEKEQREMCVRADTGYLIYGQMGERRYSYSEFGPVGPRSRPRHIVVDFNSTDKVVADVNYKLVEKFDPVGFEPIVDGEVRNVCTTTRSPAAKFAPDPKYPPSVPHGYKGKIIVDVKVATDGHVLNAAALQSLQPEIDASAVETVKTWQFEPGTCDGNPVTSFTRVTVTYH